MKQTILLAIISVLTTACAVGQEDPEDAAFGLDWQEITAKELQSHVESGFDVSMRNDEGATPLMYAARESPNQDVIQALVGAGANVNAQDEEGETPLMYAEDNGNPDIIQALVDAGGEVNARTDEARERRLREQRERTAQGLDHEHFEGDVTEEEYEDLLFGRRFQDERQW